MEKGVTSIGIISKIEKRAYVKPVCEVFSLESQPMLNSVSSSMDNKNVGEDPNDPWYAEED